MDRAAIHGLTRMDIKYRVLRLGVLAARSLPVPLGYFLAECTGDILYMVSGRRRRIVRDNLGRVLGETDRRTLRRKVRGVFRNVAKNYFDLTKLSRMSLEDTDSRMRAEGWQNITESLNSGRGTILATAHIGNFDAVARFLALHGVDTAIFVEAFDSSPLLRNVGKLRKTTGCRILPVGMGAMKDSMQVLRRGGTLTIVCDRDLQSNGMKVKFFGEETSLPVGAVSLALRTGAAIVPIFGVRLSGSRSAVCVEPPLKLVDVGERSESTRINLERFAAVMEKYIRRYPEQWTVMEPIWRNHTDEPGATGEKGQEDGN